MDTLLNKSNELNLYYDKGNYTDGQFTFHKSGSTGYGGNDVYNKPVNALSVTIYCKNKDDKELFFSLKNTVEHFQSDVTRVHVSEPTPRQIIISLKPEHEEEVNHINKQNKEIDNKYDSLCDQLFELGCERVEGLPNHIEVPMEYYNTKDEYYYNQFPITVYCTNDSNIYKPLMDHLEAITVK